MITSVVIRLKNHDMVYIGHLFFFTYAMRFSKPDEVNWWHLGKCTFGRATAFFALAMMSDDQDEILEFCKRFFYVWREESFLW